jgi:hypothetical protein
VLLYRWNLDRVTPKPAVSGACDSPIQAKNGGLSLFKPETNLSSDKPVLMLLRPGVRGNDLKL